jgi:hypothetical protein
MNIYFLSGLPRSGNTLLSSILNQNNNLKITANSFLPQIFYYLFSLKKEKYFLNFPDHNSIDNVINNIHKNYYQNWNVENIIERASWGIEAYLNILQQIKKERKFILLVRPVLEVLASFIKIEKPQNIHEKCDELMGYYGMIGMSLNSTKNIILKKETYILINFNDLISDTENQVKKIYDFLNIPFYKHDYKNLNQLKINNVEYDDSLLSANYHTIKTEGINYNKYLISDYLPNDIIKKYSNLDCWL